MSMRGDLLFIDSHKLAHKRGSQPDENSAPRLMLRLWTHEPRPPHRPTRAAPPLDGGAPDLG